MLHRSGVYKITNTKTKKFYIGSSNHLSGRWFTHLCHLRKNDHGNIHLQRSWNKHGEDSFKFEILFYCDERDLILYEQLCLDSLNPEYNIHIYADRPTGITRSPEMRQRIRNTLMGRKLSDEHKANIGLGVRGTDNGNAKLNWFKVQQIRKLYTSGKCFQQELAEMFGVVQPTISQIIREVTWRQ